MFNWIPINPVLFWIWFAGLWAMSLPVFFVWVLNSAFLGDSCDKWFRRRMFVWFTFLGFVMTWLWPVGLVGFGIYEFYTRRKQAKWDKKWAEKKATVPHYWRDAYLILDGNVTDIQVRILDWELDYSAGKARLALWRGDSRFWADKGKEILVYWPNKDLQLIPEDEASV
jgi:hypothetical protein